MCVLLVDVHHFAFIEAVLFVICVRRSALILPKLLGKLIGERLSESRSGELCARAKSNDGAALLNGMQRRSNGNFGITSALGFHCSLILCLKSIHVYSVNLYFQCSKLDVEVFVAEQVRNMILIL